MMQKVLTSPSDAIPLTAELFVKTRTCSISVQEDRAFKSAAFLDLGQITLFPDQTESETQNINFAHAVRFGAFEWITPDEGSAVAEIMSCLGPDRVGQLQPNKEDKTKRISDLLGGIPVRLGLSHPLFDPRCLENMPFKRPTTIITDTSGVLQGALSFVARFLHPAARIKVPAVVQMEIVNFADRFLSNRRAAAVKHTDLLMDHLKSQAGQRVLLQLELHSDVELERTFLLGDPLRGAFQREEDKELRELALQL